jgi:hypothetical protein
MSWREAFLVWFGPGIFGGVTFGDWLALLAENRFAVDPGYWLRAASITLGSLGNSVVRWREEAKYGQTIAATQVPPPIFVLGIWRSGTTHLQNLFAVDDRFGFPNLYQVSYPHTFLCAEEVASRFLRFFLPTKRAQDNVRLGFEVPSEDELALCVMTFCSLMMSSVFPRRATHYDHYATFRGVPTAEVRMWQDRLLWFARKLTVKCPKPLVLKSPLHTGRIRMLLEIFPEARFVHIHRNPYEVFQSARHTLLQVLRLFALQRTRLDIDDQTIRYYRWVVDSFCDEKVLIPQDRFHEMRFEDLERDPIGQMRRVYEALGLPEFGHVEQAMARYVDSLAGYRKNAYPPLAPELRARIGREWRRSFDCWGYPV